MTSRQRKCGFYSFIARSCCSKKGHSEFCSIKCSEETKCSGFKLEEDILPGDRRYDEVNDNGLIKNDGGDRPTYFGMWRESWTPDSYMWKDGNTVYMSYMQPTTLLGKCRFAVIDHLHRLGYEVIVPSPSPFVWPEVPADLGLITVVIKGPLGNVVALKKPPKEQFHG
jgi:hypothetical protein